MNLKNNPRDQIFFFLDKFQVVLAFIIVSVRKENMKLKKKNEIDKTVNTCRSF